MNGRKGGRLTESGELALYRLSKKNAPQAIRACEAIEERSNQEHSQE
jgi:hypothetical protein